MRLKSNRVLLSGYFFDNLFIENVTIMRNIEITPQKNSANDGNDFERVDTFSYENGPHVPRDRSVRISELLVEVDRTDVGRKLIR